MNHLPFDVARCAGLTDHPLCQTCKRQQQVALDPEERWYPYIYYVPEANYCPLRISGKREEATT